MGSSRTRDWTRVPCIGSWILNHCATRWVPRTSFLKQTKIPLSYLTKLTIITYCYLIPGPYSNSKNKVLDFVQLCTVVCSSQEQASKNRKLHLANVFLWSSLISKGYLLFLFTPGYLSVEDLESFALSTFWLSWIWLLAYSWYVFWWWWSSISHISCKMVMKSRDVNTMKSKSFAKNTP